MRLQRGFEPGREWNLAFSPNHHTALKSNGSNFAAPRDRCPLLQGNWLVHIFEGGIEARLGGKPFVERPGRVETPLDPERQYFRLIHSRLLSRGLPAQLRDCRGSQHSYSH